MHGTDQVAALHLDGGHRPPSTPRGKPRRQLQMALHMLDLPKRQGDSGSKEVSKTRSQAEGVDAAADAARLMHDVNDDMQRMFAGHMTPGEAPGVAAPVFLSGSRFDAWEVPIR